MDNIGQQPDNSQNELEKYELLKYRLTTEMQRSDRQGSTFSIIALHVESPKIRGIAYPKSVLTPYITSAIKYTIRNLDIASRDDKKDFIILLNDANENIATLIAKRLLAKMTFLNSPDIETQVSIGIANYPNDSQTTEELLQAAKYAMYQSRQKNKNEISTISSIRKGLSWEQEANNALSASRKRFNGVIESTVKSLLATFAMKNEYLEVHSLQVAKISAILAESLGLKEDYVREITLAALLHDVGLLDVPDHILNKETPLTPDELEIIHKHPQTATEKILKPVKSLQKMLPIILDHHERWDGRGYPFNKRERDIHIGSRIISIADSYQAMISDRPHREALDQESTIINLRQGSGTIWEDKLIAAFIELLNDSQTAMKIIDRRA